MKRLFIVTGDPSGDIHAGKVVAALQQLEPNLTIEAVGGEALAKAGIPLLADQSKMGKTGLVALTGTIEHWLLGKKIIKHLKTFQPDGVLLVDYGGFNLWLAKHLKAQGYKVFYFIPPQIWASRKGRLKVIQKYIDHVFCIFPFEKALYEAHQIPTTYVGHPLVGELPPPASKEAFCQEHGLNPDLPIVGLFPGSRKSEVQQLLQPLLAAAEELQNKRQQSNLPPLQFALAQASALDPFFFQQVLRNAQQTLKTTLPLKILSHHNHAILSVSDLALVASGTVTLEAALYGTPMVITYKGPWLIYQVVLRIAYVNCLGLPNILSGTGGGLGIPQTGKPHIVPERMQYQATGKDIAEAAWPLLDKASPEYHQAVGGFTNIRETLTVGNTPETVAKALLHQFASSEC